MSGYTIGGFPESEAYTWCPRSYLKLGKIIFGLVSGSAQARLRAYGEYSELRRHFMVDEWDRYIAQLDEYRKRGNHETLSCILDKISKELISQGSISSREESDTTLPTLAEITPAASSKTLSEPPRPAAPKVEAEQLSLF